jgi:putative endonuclease
MDWRGLLCERIIFLMFYVYLLANKRRDIYVGFTADLRQRFCDHNCGRVESTKKRRSWKLAYYEAYVTEIDARLREKTLKNYGSTLGQLKKRIRASINF